MLTSVADMLFKLLLALAAGALIGAERERRDRSAGLRTHMLVCGGSALITLVSIHLSRTGDPGRIAAQIVTGIGFLGAGTIFRSGGAVRGLTTAAGVWVAAGIGMGIAAGGELAVVSAITAVLVVIINFQVRAVEDRWLRQHQELLLTLSREHEAVAALFSGLEQLGVRLESLEWLTEHARGDEAILRLRLHVPENVSRGELERWLAAQQGIRLVRWM